MAKEFNYEIVPTSDSFAFFDYMRENMELYLIKCIIHAYNVGFTAEDAYGLMYAFLKGTFQDNERIKEALINACNKAIDAIDNG